VSYLVSRFACGHAGRDSEPGNANSRTQVRAFIRVAEIRGAPVVPVAKPCPDCRPGTVHRDT